VARTAVVAGTATAVSNRVSRRQAGRWAAQEPRQPESDYEPAEPAEPADAGMTGRLAQLEKLGQLRARGVLSEAEFEQQKAQILNG
jgi:hypothetical protein